jgi:hypothetical protein
MEDKGRREKCITDFISCHSGLDPESIYRDPEIPSYTVAAQFRMKLFLWEPLYRESTI